MKKLVLGLVAVVALALGCTHLEAQAYPGSQASLLPNYTYTPTILTAASQNGATLYTGGLSAGTIQVTGVSLTTATWSIQGSNDGAATWFSLPTAVYPTTALVSTLAVTETTTATAHYVVNLAGLTNVRFITTSGTFTATSVTFVLVASANKGLL